MSSTDLGSIPIFEGCVLHLSPVFLVWFVGLHLKVGSKSVLRGRIEAAPQAKSPIMIPV